MLACSLPTPRHTPPRPLPSPLCAVDACRYIAPCNVSEGLEVGRLCIVDATTIPAGDVSFAVSGGLSNGALYTFTSQSAGPLGGAYLAVGTKVSGACNFAAPNLDAILTTTPSSPDAATWALVNAEPQGVTINVNDVTHPVNPWCVGSGRLLVFVEQKSHCGLAVAHECVSVSVA